MRRVRAMTGLLLGLKGSLNEYELDLLRQRSLAARARRGELIVAAPTGYVKTADKPGKTYATKERVNLIGTDQRITPGSAVNRPHSKAEYMTALERFARFPLAPRAPSIHEFLATTTGRFALGRGEALDTEQKLTLEALHVYNESRYITLDIRP